MSNLVQRHPYHIVDPSPWPFLTGISALGTTSGFIMYMHCFQGGFYLFLIGFISLVNVSFFWWRDVIREATFQGHHTTSVQTGLSIGMLLFILSEIMFFFAFFWAFFASSLSPSLDVGGIWPPPGIDVLNPWEVPLLNTVVLLLSGVTCTWSHNAIVIGNRSSAIISISLTIFLGAFFTLLQAIEYYEASFTMSDGIYGSVFFLATGFHGFHVLIGSTFLFVCFIRLYKHHFTTEHHFGFESAAWYWHFVDVVWLFLFVSIYWWGGL